MRWLLRGMGAPEEAEKGERYLRRQFKNMPVLEGERLRLRPPALTDADDLYTYARDPENSRYVLWAAHRSPQESQDVLRSIISRNKRGLPGTYAIVLKAEDRLIGTIGFQAVDAFAGTAELGYSIARRLWNRGLTTEALALLLPWAFGPLRLRRLEAQHDVRNPASGRALEKAGFHLEGTSRHSLQLKGDWADMAHYAILLEDWQRQRGGA